MSNLTDRNDGRFVLFPIKHPDLWKAYKEAEASFWTVEELDFASDISDWNSLTDNERYFLSNILAFFAASDGIVGENLAMRFYNDVSIPEARIFYGYQLMIEGIHSEAYSMLIDTYIKNQDEKHKLLNAINTIDIVKKKADWAIKWINSSASFEERLVAFAAVEGIFFSSSFCSIYWLKKRGLMPGLSVSNDFISKDEGSHTDFACMLYKLSDQKIDDTVIKQIIQEAVEIECEFATKSLPVELIGMNSNMMSEYIRFISDRLLVSLGCDKTYNAENPFDFMEMISLQGKSNFFEKRAAEYRKSGVGVSNNDIAFNVDF